MDSSTETNRIELSGIIESLPEYSHKSYGEAFYCMKLAIRRKSGYCDNIPVIISERLIWDIELTESAAALVTGQIRTYNEIANGKNKLNIRVSGIYSADDDACSVNKVYLEGYLCKPRSETFRSGREICDIMLAVNRMYNNRIIYPASHGEEMPAMPDPCRWEQKYISTAGYRAGNIRKKKMTEASLRELLMRYPSSESKNSLSLHLIFPYDKLRNVHIDLYTKEGIKMRIVIDGMGGDNAPSAIVQGCVEAAALISHQILIVEKKLLFIKN